MTEVLEEYPSILKAIPNLTDELSMFDKHHILGMNNSETEDMIRDWIKSSASNFSMYDDNTVIIETFNDLHSFFRDYDFMKLNQMLEYIEDPSSLEDEMDLDKSKMDIQDYINDDIIDMIHATFVDNQIEMFDISKKDKVINTLRRLPSLYMSIVDDIIEDMHEASAAAMDIYLEEGIKGDSHEHGVMGFLFDTERSHSNGFLLVTDEARNFQDSDYAMSLELYEFTQQFEAGYEELSDRDLEYEASRYFGEEFDHNPDLKPASDFYRIPNMTNLKGKIAFTLRNWDGKF